MRKTQRKRRLKKKRDFARESQLARLRRFHPEWARVVMWVDELAEWPSDIDRWTSVLRSFVGAGTVGGEIEMKSRMDCAKIKYGGGDGRG